MLLRTLFKNSSTLNKDSNLGEWAESLALEFLTRNSLKLRERNFRCKLGEIDLIMDDARNLAKQTRDQQTQGLKILDTKKKEAPFLVFVEVRYRKQARFGSAVESVTQHKQKKLLNTAQYYLQQHDLNDRVCCRFDIVSVQPKPANEVPLLDDNIGRRARNSITLEQFNIEWVENAFCL